VLLLTGDEDAVWHRHLAHQGVFCAGEARGSIEPDGVTRGEDVILGSCKKRGFGMVNMSQNHGLPVTTCIDQEKKEGCARDFRSWNPGKRTIDEHI
jgi:hypothetical protein